MMTAALDFTNPHVLRNKREYRAAIEEIDTLLDRDPKSGTNDYERLKFLSVLVEAYEDEHEPADERGTPQTVVAFMIEQAGWTRSDLATIMGGRARVSEFFAGKRRLSIAQIKKLRDALGIPADLLID